MKNKHITDEEIILYIDNELSVENRIRLDEHIKRCNSCKQKLKEYKTIEQYLKKPVLYEPPVDLLNSILDNVWHKKLSFEEMFIGLLITFSSLIAVLGFLFYRYGFNFFYKITFFKLDLPHLIKTGVNNFNELLYVFKKLYYILGINFINKISIPKHGLIGILLILIVLISYIKKDIIIKGKK